MTGPDAARPPPVRAGLGAVAVPVFVVVPTRLLLLDLAGPVEVLRYANRVQERLAFAIRYVGPRRTVRSSVALDISRVGKLPRRLPESAWVLLPGDVERLPGEDGPAAAALAESETADRRAIVDWLRRTITPDHTLICICTGALYAAAAGLLDGHACTTHHASCAELARVAPGARVATERLFVEDRGRYSSAGISAGIDLMLHILARHTDIACAMAVARYLIVHRCRDGGDPQLSPWLDGRRHAHPAIHRVQDAIAADLTRHWRQEELARLAGASGRHLGRLFRRHTGMSVADYAGRLRVTLARQLLRETRLDMEHVAERCGFASPRQLHRVWRRYCEGTPSACRPARQAASDGAYR